MDKKKMLKDVVKAQYNVVSMLLWCLLIYFCMLGFTTFWLLATNNTSNYETLTSIISISTSNTVFLTSFIVYGVYKVMINRTESNYSIKAKAVDIFSFLFAFGILGSLKIYNNFTVEAVCIIFAIFLLERLVLFGIKWYKQLQEKRNTLKKTVTE